jgi:hypothetical protein
MAADSDKADSKTTIPSQLIDKAPAYLTLLTVGIGALAYFEQQGKELQQREAEYRAMKYKDTLPLYKEICMLAAQISLAKDREAAQPLMDKFHVLYYAQLAMVPDEGVREAADLFLNKVEASQSSGLFPDPDIPVYVSMLAEACKTSLDKISAQDAPPSAFGLYCVLVLFAVGMLIILCLLLVINRLYQDRNSSPPAAIDQKPIETQPPSKP